MAGAIVLAGGLLLAAYLLVDELLPARPAAQQEAMSSVRGALEDLNLGSYLAIGIAVVIAFAMRNGPIVAVAVLIIGSLAGYYIGKRARRLEEADIDEEILKLIESFRGIYRVSPAIFSGLEEARLKVKDPLRSDVTAAVEAFRATSSSRRAYAVLRRRSDNPYLAQFVYILESTDIAPREAVLDAMGGLLDRLRRHQAMRDETSVELTGITVQTRFTLIVSVAIVLVVAAIRPLRLAYTGSLFGQLLFTAATALSAYSAYRIDQRVLSLKEKVI